MQLHDGVSSLVHHADEEVATEERSAQPFSPAFLWYILPSIQTHLKVSLVNAPRLFLPNQVVNQNQLSQAHPFVNLTPNYITL